MLIRAINYTRVFTEMGESLVEAIVKTPNQVRHFSRVLQASYCIACKNYRLLHLLVGGRKRRIASGSSICAS